MDMGNSLAQGRDAGLRQAAIVSGAVVEGRCLRQAEAHGNSNSNSQSQRWRLVMLWVGRGRCGLAGDAVNPSLEAWRASMR
jgi:hypothetical protein